MVSNIWLRLGLILRQTTSSILLTLTIPRTSPMSATWLCLRHFLMSLYPPCCPLERQHLSRESFVFKFSHGTLVHLREIYPAGQFRCSHGDGEPECQALPLPPHPGEWPARSLQQPRRKHCQGRWVGGGTCRRDFRFLFLFPVFTPYSIFIAIWLLLLFKNLHSCITLLGNLLASHSWDFLCSQSYLMAHCKHHTSQRGRKPFIFVFKRS